MQVSTVSQTAKRGAKRGFTLVEMMIVVAILGILAAISIPTYTNYVYRSKTAEAIGFLSEIKARQESYRADFGTYCAVSADANDWNPNANPGVSTQAWVATAAWQELGASPPGQQVLFSYLTVAGVPGTTPANAGFGSNLGYAGTDYWFVSRALGDLDGDGTQVTFESYSEAQQIWIGCNGTTCAGGWE